MAKLYSFDDAGRREYRQIKKVVLGGGTRSQTKVYKKWERGNAAKGTSNRWARVTSAISAATSATAWGSGQVKLQDVGAGALAASAIDVDNVWLSDFVVDAQVLVDIAFDPPRVLNGTCEAVTW
jgi:hypothetical protein